MKVTRGKREVCLHRGIIMQISAPPSGLIDWVARGGNNYAVLPISCGNACETHHSLPYLISTALRAINANSDYVGGILVGRKPLCGFPSAAPILLNRKKWLHTGLLPFFMVEFNPNHHNDHTMQSLFVGQILTDFPNIQKENRGNL